MTPPRSNWTPETIEKVHMVMMKEMCSRHLAAPLLSVTMHMEQNKNNLYN